jgi:hypothetical protein
MLLAARPRSRVLSPGRGKRFSFSNCPDWLWGPPSFLPVARNEFSLGERQPEREGNDSTPPERVALYNHPLLLCLPRHGHYQRMLTVNTLQLVRSISSVANELTKVHKAISSLYFIKYDVASKKRSKFT